MCMFYVSVIMCVPIEVALYVYVGVCTYMCIYQGPKLMSCIFLDHSWLYWSRISPWTQNLPIQLIQVVECLPRFPEVLRISCKGFIYRAISMALAFYKFILINFFSFDLHTYHIFLSFLSSHFLPSLTPLSPSRKGQSRMGVNKVWYIKLRQGQVPWPLHQGSTSQSSMGNGFHSHVDGLVCVCAS